MFAAKKLATILSLNTGGGGGQERTGVLVQDIYDAPRRGEFINKGTLVTIFCADSSMLQIVLDTDSEVVDTVVSPPEAEESLWCIEGQLRFGTNETVG